MTFIYRTITIQEWELQSHENILEAMKQINSGKILRNYIDTILKQIVDDLNSQVDKTNEAFNKRICETKEIKSTFETQHADVIRNIIIVFLLIFLNELKLIRNIYLRLLKKSMK